MKKTLIYDFDNPGDKEDYAALREHEKADTALTLISHMLRDYYKHGLYQRAYEKSEKKFDFDAFDEKTKEAVSEAVDGVCEKIYEIMNEEEWNW